MKPDQFPRLAQVHRRLSQVRRLSSKLCWQAYLWYREHLEGRDEGQKDRPCAIVAAIRADENGDTGVIARFVQNRTLSWPRVDSDPRPSL